MRILRRGCEEMVMVEQQEEEGEGGGVAYKVDWRDEGEKERWSQSVGPRVCRPSTCHLSVRLTASLFPTVPRHFLTSARYPPPRLSLVFPFVVFFSDSSLPSSCRVLPSLILSLNGKSCEQPMQMRWLLPHCSSSRAEETLIG